MDYLSDPRLKFLTIFIVVLVIAGIIGIVGTVAYNAGGEQSDSGTPKIEIVDSQYDFGDIKIDGGVVKHSFEIGNNGDADLKLSNISTSCMCTTAVLEVDGEKSPEFGMHKNPAFWSKKLAPGQTASLEATFDPMAHGLDAIGPVTRGITMYSNDGGGKDVKTVFMFTANVIR